MAMAALVVAGLSASRLLADQDIAINVDTSEAHQSMRGWEVTARVWETNKRLGRFDSSWEAYQDELMDRMVNELGINRVRIEVKSGAENPVDYWAQFRDGKIGYREFSKLYYAKINDNADPNLVNESGFQFSSLDYQIEKIVLPLAKLIEANGEKLYVNLNYVDFGGGAVSDVSHARNPEEYAELIRAAFDHIKIKYGFVPNALEVTLEPENTDHWRGREIGNAIVATVRRLKQGGFTPDIIAPSTTAASAAPTYFDELATVAGATGLMTELAYHRYRDRSPDQFLPAIAARAKQYGLHTAMLEHVAGDALELHADLTVANAAAWQQYGVASELPLKEKDRGVSYYIRDLASPGGPKIKMAERTRGLAQYFRFVRFGATRIGARLSSGDARPVAFRNPDGTIIVVVQSDKAGPIRVQGLPASTFGIRYTTNLETARELPSVTIDANQTLIGTLPAPGIITFYEATPAAPGRP